MIPGTTADLRFLDLDLILDEEEEASGAFCFGNVAGDVPGCSSSSSSGEAARFLPAALLDMLAGCDEVRLIEGCKVDSSATFERTD